MKLLLLLSALTPLFVTAVANAVGYTFLPVCPDVNNPWQSYANTAYQVGGQIASLTASGAVVPPSLQEAYDNNMNAYAKAEGPCV